METTEPTEYNALVARAIRSEIAGQQLTLRALSDKTGISLATLQRLVQGKREMRVEDLYVITKALGLDMADVVSKATNDLEGK